MLAAVLCVPGLNAFGASSVVLKVATIAPEGSTWHRVMMEFASELKEKTQGRVVFKVYPGGVAGDEAAVVGKIRIGQLDGGAFTGMGMGMIAKEARILDLPFFFNNRESFHCARTAVTPFLRKKFDEKGFVLVGWVDLGESYFYSTKPISDLASLRKTKVWVWEGDDLARTCLEEIGIKAVPLSVVDVMMGLQTGLIDTVYNTGLGAVSFQWYTRTRFRCPVPLGFHTASLLIRKNRFIRISKNDQKILLELADKHFEKLNDLVNQQNQEALAVMEKRGVKTLSWPEADIEVLRDAAARIHRRLIGELYPRQLFELAVEGKKCGKNP